jgi:hypothetical protein
MVVAVRYFMTRWGHKRVAEWESGYIKHMVAAQLRCHHGTFMDRQGKTTKYVNIKTAGLQKLSEHMCRGYCYINHWVFLFLIWGKRCDQFSVCKYVPPYTPPLLRPFLKYLYMSQIFFQRNMVTLSTSSIYFIQCFYGAELWLCFRYELQPYAYNCDDKLKIRIWRLAIFFRSSFSEF